MQVEAPTALVTGGSDGIGKAVALGLARAGLRLLIVGRDAEKGQNAERELRHVSGNPNVCFLRADLSAMREVVELGERVTRIAPALRYLVHGAGIVRGRRALTADGIESNFAVNYLSRFQLTRELMPALLAASRPGSASRIVLLAGAARSGSIYFDDPSLARGFGMLRVVGHFCQANDVFALELARRLAESDGPSPRITISCLKIGVVKTNIRREFPTWMKILVPLVMDPLVAKTPEEVAGHALELILGAAHEGATGKHFLLIRRFRPMEPNATARRPETGRRLWELSERLVKGALDRSLTLPQEASTLSSTVSVTS